MESINWGIIGCGNIAVSFAEDLKIIPDAKLLAVASRSKERAENLGRKFNVERRYDNYSALAGDPDVDVVYIATRHQDHLHASQICLEQGKSLLVEKPICVNASETRQLIELARKQNVFLMEAMWTRFLPVIRMITKRIRSGDIGKVTILFADFGFKAPFDPESRVFNPELAGGALLDIGIYPISLASHVFMSKPDDITSRAIIGETGIDEISSCLFKYRNGALAVLASTVTGRSPQMAYILGEEGAFHIPFFWKARKATLIRNGKTEETLEPEFKGIGYNYEAMAVMECLRNGEKENTIMPLDETYEIMQTLDQIRSQIGLKYPFEE